LTWAFTPAVAVTLVVFAISGAMVATRTVTATVYGFSVAGDLGREVAAARAPETAVEHPPTMPTRYVPLRRGSGLVIRPLRNGDRETVTAVFEMLGETSRRMRFNGPKPRLSDL